MSQFVHLHLHTQYSLLDGANKLPDVVEMAAKLGHQAVAITDHGNMHGAVEFYDAAKKNHIKPIIGCELYVNPVSRHERKTKAQGGAKTHHLTVLAKDATGYKNLCRLVTLAYREGFYFKPRVDHEILKEYSEGLIVLSGCLAGEVNHFVTLEDRARCKERIEFYASLFPDRYYLEIQPHPIPEQRALNEACIDIAKELGLPLTATTDCHYPSKDDHFAQEVLMCIATQKQITDPTRIRHEGVALHLKDYSEMLEEFGPGSAIPEALANTAMIAQQCNFDFDFSTYYMPLFEADPELTLDQTMEKRARDGLLERLDEIRLVDPDWQDSNIPDYEERLQEEIDLIVKMGFSGYFLVVADFINWAKDHDIPVGPGRGSAAGSLVAYCMGITELDPIANKLLFERFLNPERVSLPDIDVDFCINGRDQVIKYVVEKYGKDKVAQIATFGTLKAKAAIKDVGRALGISYAETDRIAQLVPAPRQGFDYPLKEAIKMEPKLREYAEGEGQQLMELAQKLEGVTRHSSTHAAGVVIGDKPLTELLPLMVDKDSNDVTQFSMKYVEKIGLVKFDFLGLKTLTVIQTACKIIKGSQGREIDIGKIPLVDSKTFSLLCSGNTTGVFQLESGGITEMTVRLKPSCFDDLVATIALYRPGPLDAGMVDHYIERKHGRAPVRYLHPKMENTLKDTYGIILYQEQIMQLARELAGYSLAEADLLRRAMGKKVPEEMAKQRTRFVDGATERDVPKKVATEIFDQMETFARYGFNRSHSAAYGLITYQTAYLKAHYPVEFMAALMSHEMNDSDKTLKNLNECRNQKIVLLPPDINESSSGFIVSDGKIRYGLSAVKGVGEKAVQSILDDHKENGNFSDLEEFVSRVGTQAVNKKVLENLIKCGAFDSFGFTRRELHERMDEVLRMGQSLAKSRNSNQVSLFGDGELEQTIPKRSTNRPEWPINQKLSMEREALGFYISGHPLEKFLSALARLGVVTVEAVKARQVEGEVRMGGVVTALKLKNTKKGDRYASFSLEDSTGSIESLMWPRTYKEVGHLLVNDEPFVVSGRAEVTEERCNLVVNNIESLIDLRDRSAKIALLTFDTHDKLERDTLEKFKDIVGRYPGTCPLRVVLNGAEGEVTVALRDERKSPICVTPSEEFSDRVEQVFGKPALSFL